MTARLGDRSLYPELEAIAYLNHAAVSPACLPARRAVQQLMDDYAQHGFGAFLRWHAQRERLRRDLAKLLNAEPSEVALGIGTTRGVSDIALCFPWSPGDRVLLFEGEFPANITPWQRAAELFDLQLVFLKADDFQSDLGLERLGAELEKGVRLVAVSAVQFQTGLRMPLAAIGQACHEFGAELFVDAIQACGVVPIDVQAEQIDYLSCGSHKWMLGFEGAGFLYAKAECAARLRPTTAGWLSHDDPISFLRDGAGHLKYDRPIRQQIDFTEIGTPNILGFAALGATTSFLLELAPHNILAHANLYLDELERGLLERGFKSLRSDDPARRSAILCVQHDAHDLGALSRQLSARTIYVGYPDGNLRFAPHFSNSLDEIPRVLAELDALLG